MRLGICIGRCVVYIGLIIYIYIYVYVWITFVMSHSPANSCLPGCAFRYVKVHIDL